VHNPGQDVQEAITRPGGALENLHTSREWHQNNIGSVRVSSAGSVQMNRDWFPGFQETALFAFCREPCSPLPGKGTVLQGTRFAKRKYLTTDVKVSLIYSRESGKLSPMILHP